MEGRYPQIAKAIREARLARKWSQERAAAEVGTSRFQWIRWEQGLHRPTGYARQLVEKLGLPEELFADDDDEEESLPDLLRKMAAIVERTGSLA